MVKYRGLLVFALVATPLVAATSSSPEEAAVKTAYARAAYSTELSSINRAIEAKKGQDISSEEIEKAKQNALRLSIGEFAITSRAGFGEEAFEALPVWNAPDGQTILQFSGFADGVSDVLSTSREQEFEPRWSTEQSYPGARAITVKDMIDAPQADDRFAWVKRIATYTVTATYQGRTETGKAYALFGDTQRRVIDELVTQMYGFATDVDAYPMLMLHTSLFDSPAVRIYLKATQVESGCCGPLSKDVQKRLNEPLKTSDGVPTTRR